MVTVRYWAGARAAAGVDVDVDIPGSTVSDVTTELARRRPGLAPVLAVATLLVDGVRVRPETVLPVGAVMEVLPPFAGG